MVSAEWVFAQKSDETSKVVKAKGRLVAKVIFKRSGVDYSEKYAPPFAAPCICLMASIACEVQLDLSYKRVLFQAELNEVVSKRVPRGYRDLTGEVELIAASTA